MPGRKTAGDEQSRPDSAPAGVSKRGRMIISGLILFHLLAVALPPLAFQTSSLDGQSPLMSILIRPFAGYGQFLHIDRGYAFFAPDPGPSHLFQAAMAQPDGSIVEQTYPDREQHWPRLLYHRHFMLAEFLNETYWPPGPPDEMFEADRAGAEIWQQGRGRYEYIRKSVVDHLKTVNDGRDVVIRRLEHNLPALTDFAAEPIELTDERLYNLLLDQPIYSDQIAPTENVETEVIPAPRENGDGAEESESEQSP